MKIFPTHIRQWLNNLPINDPVERRMAVLLQVMLLGVMTIVLLAALLNVFISTELEWQTIIPRTIVSLCITGLPLLLLRYGYYRSSTSIIIALFFILETFAATTAQLRNIAETLSFFTLAIILAGLLVSRWLLALTFVLSGAVVIFSAVREQSAGLDNDGLVVALNFILLNGLISLFIDRFSGTLRAALQATLEREGRLQQEIQERRRIEEQHKLLIQELETKNAELERFTYTVSHDLKTPLVTINGFLGYLERDLLSGNVERFQRDRQRIQEAVNKMHLLLGELLELSRIGRLINPSQMIPFAALVDDVLKLVQGRLEAAGVTVNVLPELPDVYGDRQRLAEVLQNLIDNAAKAVHGQANAHIEIGQQGEEGGKPIFYIQDNGIGIAAQHHEHIFGLFNKLDAHSESTGVGLALVKRIVEVHNGRIWVESEPGKGATFYFTLPTRAEIA